MHSEVLGAGFVLICCRSCVVPVARLLGVVYSQRHLERLACASRGSPVELGEIDVAARSTALANTLTLTLTLTLILTLTLTLTLTEP